MEENERKYEILPGVKLPDMKTIREASSNFEESGVDDMTIDSFVNAAAAVDAATTQRLTPDEIKRLQELGDEVAEKESRDAEESRKKMAEIMRSAVTQSASIDDLKQSAIQHAYEDKLAEMEQRQKEEAERIAEEEEKQRVREERRALQRKQLEDARAKAAEAKAEESPAEEAPASAVEPEVDIDSTGVIQSDEATFEDFGEFLDDDKNN